MDGLVVKRWTRAVVSGIDPKPNKDGGLLTISLTIQRPTGQDIADLYMLAQGNGVQVVIAPLQGVLEAADKSGGVQKQLDDALQCHDRSPITAKRCGLPLGHTEIHSFNAGDAWDNGVARCAAQRILAGGEIHQRASDGSALGCVLTAGHSGSHTDIDDGERRIDWQNTMPRKAKEKPPTSDEQEVRPRCLALNDDKLRCTRTPQHAGGHKYDKDNPGEKIAT